LFRKFNKDMFFGKNLTFDAILIYKAFNIGIDFS